MIRLPAALLLLALPAPGSACPSLEDPFGPASFIPVQAVGVLLAFTVLQDFLYRFHMRKARAELLDPRMLLSFLFLGLTTIMVATTVATGEGWSQDVHPAFAFNLAFCEAVFTAAWGTLLVGIPMAVLRLSCGLIRSRLLGEHACPAEGPWFGYRRTKDAVGSEP